MRKRLAKKLIMMASDHIEWDYAQWANRDQGRAYYEVEPFTKWMLNKLVHYQVKLALFIYKDAALDQMVDECWWG